MNVYSWDGTGYKVVGNDIFVGKVFESVVQDNIIDHNTDPFGDFKKINAIKDLRTLTTHQEDEDTVCMGLKEAKYIIEAIAEGPLKEKVALDDWTILFGPIYYSNNVGTSVPNLTHIANLYRDHTTNGRLKFQAEREPNHAYKTWECGPRITGHTYRGIVPGDILHNLTTDTYYLVKPIGFDIITIETRPYFDGDNDDLFD